MIKKLNENNALKFKTLSEEEKKKKGILGRLYGPVASFKSPTRNGRKYTQELWEKLFESDLIKERFNNGGIFGELCHPDYEEVDMAKVAVIMPEPPVKDENGQLVTYLDILDTPCGKVAYQLAKYGYKFGISSRGTGDIIETFDGNSEVDPETYQLNAFDLVEIPAVESARLAFVESLDTKKKYGKTLNQKLSEELEKADESERKIMKEALKNLDINLNEGKELKKYLVLDKHDKDLFDSFDTMKEVKKYLKDHRWTEEDVTITTNKEDINWDLTEGLVKPTEDEINQIKSDLNKIGFDVDREGETLFGAHHLQLILRGEDHDAETLHRVANELSDLSDKYKDFAVTYNVGLTDKYEITCGLDIRDKHVPDEVDEELENEDGWGETIRGELEDTFSSLEDLMYEIRNCRRGAYSIYGDSVADLVGKLNTLASALKDDAERIDNQEDILTEETANFIATDKETGCKIYQVGDKFTTTCDGKTLSSDSMDKLLNDLKSEHDKKVNHFQNLPEEFYLHDAKKEEVRKALAKEADASQLRDDALSMLGHNELEKLVRKYLSKEQRKGLGAEILTPDEMEQQFGVRNLNDLDESIDPENYTKAIKAISDGIESDENLEEIQKYLQDIIGYCRSIANDYDILVEEDSHKVHNNGDNEVVDNQSELAVNELKEALRNNSDLEASMADIQNKLAVSDAKVNELTEQLAKYKELSVRLNSKAKKSVELSEKVSLLEESLNKLTKERKLITHKTKKLRESLSDTKGSSEKLNEDLNLANDKIKRLNEELSDIKLNSEILEKENKEKMDKLNHLVESYKAVANDTMRKYIESKAIMYGISFNDIVGRLPKAYTADDVDRLCESLRSYSINTSRLPFGFKPKIKFKESKNDNLRINNPADEIDEDLFLLANAVKK